MNDEPDARTGIPIYLRWAALMTLAWVLIVGSAIVLARTGEEYRCVEVGPYNVYNPLNRDISLLDTVTKRFLPDSRPNAQNPIAFSTAPNQSTVLFLARERPKDTTLTFFAAPVLNPNAPADRREYGQPAVLQRGLQVDPAVIVPTLNTAWSSDQRQIAWLWIENRHLTLHAANANGENPRRIEFLQPLGLDLDPNAIELHSWSPDDRWIVLSEKRLSGAQFSQFWLLDAATLARVPWTIEGGLYLRGDWNPARPQFAALAEDRAERQKIVLWSPDKTLEFDINAKYANIYDFDWSPDGRFLALRVRRCPDICWWDYVIIGADGMLLQGWRDDVSAIKMPNAGDFRAVSNSPIDNPTTMFNGLWTPQGSEWVYLRSDSSPTLVARNVETGAERVIAENVVYDLMNGILKYSSSYYPDPSRRFVPIRQTLIIPHLATQAKTITLEMMDIDGGNRVILAEGINGPRAIIDPGVRLLGFSRWWPFGAQIALVTWAETGGQQTRLAYARPDGSVRHSLTIDAQNVQMLTTTPGHWLVYAINSGTNRFFYALKLARAEPINLMQVGITSTWRASGNTATESLALQVGLRAEFLVRDEARRLNILRTSSTYLTWAPDGQKLAFTRFEPSIPGTVIDVIAPDGTLLEESAPITTPGYLNLEALRWTRCN